MKMINFKSICNFISSVRSRPLRFLSSTQDYSCYRYNSSTVALRTQTCSSVFQSNKLFLQREVLVSNILFSRSLSLSNVLCVKSKDRGGKEKKKPKAAKLDLREVAEFFDPDDLTNQMSQAIENMKLEFIKNLSIRSTTGALEQLKVKVENKEYQLQELAQIARKPKLIVLNVAAFPTAIPDIIKAIETSGLNINPQQDGTTLFLPIPKVTKEHRENLAKNAKAIYIKHRDHIKDIRNNAVKTMKKKKGVSEDVICRVQAQIETLCDKYVKEAELVLETKQDELLGSTD